MESKDKAGQIFHLPNKTKKRLSQNQFDCHIEFGEILTIKLSTFARLRLTQF